MAPSTPLNTIFGKKKQEKKNKKREQQCLPSTLFLQEAPGCFSTQHWTRSADRSTAFLASLSHPPLLSVAPTSKTTANPCTKFPQSAVGALGARLLPLMLTVAFKPTAPAGSQRRISE